MVNIKLSLRKRHNQLLMLKGTGMTNRRIAKSSSIDPCFLLRKMEAGRRLI